MGLVHRVLRWYKLNYGVGNTMLAEGAELLACPHCETDTPIYRSAYDSAGDPVSFSVCLWCGGLIEYSDLSGRPHEPYVSARDLQLDQHRSRP
jgi:hypothetical protein